MDDHDISADTRGVCGCRDDSCGSGSGNSGSSNSSGSSGDFTAASQHNSRGTDPNVNPEDFAVDLHPELAAARNPPQPPAIEPLLLDGSHEAEVDQGVQGSIAACRSRVHFDPE